MAKRDVVNYYISVQIQYLEMLEDIKDFDEALKNGLVSQEQYDQAQEMIAKLKENYERLSYIMLLLDEPNRASKKAKHKKQNVKVYDYLSNNNESYIHSENEEVLKQFKALLKEVKNG